ncbi:hypothetical protein SEVIR_9G497001v4 [Setaria viridis]
MWRCISSPLMVVLRCPRPVKDQAHAAVPTSIVLAVGSSAAPHIPSTCADMLIPDVVFVLVPDLYLADRLCVEWRTAGLGLIPTFAVWISFTSMETTLRDDDTCGSVLRGYRY